MSQNHPADNNADDAISPSSENQTPEKEDVQWTYSGKAMRAQCLLYSVITCLIIGAGIYATISNLLGNAYLLVWIGTGVVVGALWLVFFVTYFYRIWSLKYKLTNHRLYFYEGFFTRTSDSMELVYIEDIQLVQTFFDRIFNGGVGRLVIFSSADKTHPKLFIKGIENPQPIFEKIDKARADVRARRAILSGT
jgi:membrane protein YdbS with pleckstrin-like domain